MYFFNKDGHEGANRMRDYQIEVYPTKENWADYDRKWTISSWEELEKLALIAEMQSHEEKPLCKMRINNFWGGVHKQFIVSGSAHYLVKIDRNYSFNTIISSVGIDRILGEPTDDEKRGIPYMAGVPYIPPKFPDKYSTETSTEVYALWNLLDSHYNKLGSVEIQRLFRISIRA
jgi:hypothetical protein